MGSFSKSILLALALTSSDSTEAKRHLDDHNLSEIRVVAKSPETNKPIVAGAKAAPVYKPVVNASTCKNLCIFGGPGEPNKWCFNF